MILLSNIQIQLYYIEQYLSHIISTDLNDLNPLTLCFLIISGCLTSFNPCFISIMPLIISYTSSQKSSYLNLIFFSIGLTLSFLLSIILIYFVDYQYRSILKSLPLISSSITIFLGLSLLQILSVHISPTNFHTVIFKRHSQINFFIMGTVIGFSSIPCSTPILATVLFWISFTSNFSLGLIYLLFYIIGIMLPILAFLNLINQYQNFTIFNKLWSKSILLSGSIVLSSGIFSLLNQIFS
uniref:Cytochrome c biogenesis protein transmembrane region n=1 Tax=Gelidium elegans TaxID=37200 RepID=A0A141SDM6_GELEL|nr:cytochrome c biogenesis protein transmembrane region [Gelidium elegans]AMK96394.1 cytochrome c biogenesis protein transmembrane region [Gelidium elegans]